MNKTRRKQIEKVVSILNEQYSELTDIREAEEEALDNMPEGMRYSERGEAMEAYIDALDTALDDLDMVIEELDPEKFV